MTDLPINISSAPAKITPRQQGNGNVSAQQDAPEFGNVLAKQVADNDKTDEPSTPTSGEENSHPAAKKQTVAPAAEPVTTNTLPADMLATLLVQPNQALVQQTDDKTLTATDLPSPGVQTTDKNAKLVPDLTNVNIASGKSRHEMPGVLPVAGRPTKGTKGLPEAIKTPGLFETNPGRNQLLHSKSLGSELTTTPLQPAFFSPAQSGAAVPAVQLSVSTPLTQAAWGDEFNQKVTWMANQHNQSAELHLNPPQLGPLNVVLKMDGDQATAMFTSPHAAVRDAIEQALPKLREMMAESGIMLGNAMVSDQATHKNQDQSSRKSPGRSASSSDISEVAGIPESRSTAISRHQGMVDTFA
jgi:flagellar hook-length control protein FliK